ncbi:tol-pal system protein YbgF [Uliginosibacterium sp. H3]|uniref:Cell division coordinator CpoB n=1 Tax=Uliginosibacterium silvisoli TaxID=3114758 RepID=A0ABU6JYM8_9RHOO|nr:tol-pal system protein YbgF [Uliginosibacterium sp. H3]
MKTKSALHASLLCLSLLAAPAHAGLFDDDEARRRIDQLRADVDERTQRLEEAARGQALLVNQIDSLRAEIAKLRGQLEVTTNDVEQSQKRQKDFYVDLDTRLRKLEASIAEMTKSAASAPLATPTLDPAQEPRDYELAVNALRNGKYVDAAVGFRQFIKNWPNSVNQPGANYWAATSLFQARDISTAADYYNKVVTTWPDDPLAPDAMLGLGNCQQEAGDTKASRKTLEVLVSKYPKSDAAKTAKQRLSKK